MSRDKRENTNGGDRDKRRRERFPFSAQQKIGEIIQGRMPSADEFEMVRCSDISQSGIAFYRRTLPQGDQFVVALGKAPDYVLLTARLVQSSKVDLGGVPFYRIGCQFTGRVKAPEESPPSVESQDIEAALQLMTQE
jgi:hypothetical protein